VCLACPEGGVCFGSDRVGSALTAMLLALSAAITDVMLCRAMPCCAVLCRAVLCCAVLCCAVLCCVVLCCAVLCCAINQRSAATGAVQCTTLACSSTSAHRTRGCAAPATTARRIRAKSATRSDAACTECQCCASVDAVAVAVCMCVRGQWAGRMLASCGRHCAWCVPQSCCAVRMCSGTLCGGCEHGTSQWGGKCVCTCREQHSRV
jgi:hypothetical protein